MRAVAESTGGDGPPRRLLETALATYGTNVAVAVLSLGNVLIVSRALGPAGRGGVAFLTTIAYLTSQLATLGVQQSNSNLGGRRARLRARLATNSVVLALLLGGLAAMVLGVLDAVFPRIDGELAPHLLVLALLAIPFLVLQTYFQALLQADYRFRVTNTAWLVTPIANIGVNAILLAAGWISVATAVGAWVGGQILSTAIMGWYIARRWEGFGRPDRALGGRMLSFGLRTHPGRIMLIGNYRLDQWLLGALGTTTELGLYSVAVAWAEALFYLPTALAYVQRPDLVRATRLNAGRAAASLFRAAAVLTLLLAVGMIVLAPFLCETIFGEAFEDSATMLRVLAPGALGIVALKQLGGALIAQSKPLLESLAIAAAFLCMVVLDILLIPGHGGAGASVASTVAYSAGGVAVAVIFARTLGVPLRSLVPTAAEITLPWRTIRRLAVRPAKAPPGASAEGE